MWSLKTELPGCSRIQVDPITWIRAMMRHDLYRGLDTLYHIAHVACHAVAIDSPPHLDVNWFAVATHETSCNPIGVRQVLRVAPRLIKI